MRTLKLKLFDNKLFIGFCILSILLTSGHAYQTIFTSLSYIRVLMSFIFFIPIIYVYFHNKLNILLISFLSLIIMVFSTLLIDFGKELSSYIGFIFGIVFAFGIVITYDFEDFVDIFLKTMVIASICGLVGYILLINTTLLNNLPVLTNINGVTYKSTLLFSNIHPSRNGGMFWEPGLFATFLIYAMIFEIIFNKNKTSMIRIVLFSICIFTAQSSAGYFVWVMCIALLFTNKYKSKTFFGYFMFILLTTSLILFFLNLDYIIYNTSLINNKYIAKLLTDNFKESSRFNAVLHNMSIFYKNPILGSGISEVSKYMIDVADTSTSTHLMSIYGIPGMLYTVFFICGIFKIENKNAFSKLVLVIIVLSIINKEPHGRIIFTWCLMFYLLKDKKMTTRKTKSINVYNGSNY